jgi:MbtH protein
MADGEDELAYKVVVNHEDQHSIWLFDREIPLGCREAGFEGKCQGCLSWIAKVWIDMRPLTPRHPGERAEEGR